MRDRHIVEHEVELVSSSDQVLPYESRDLARFESDRRVRAGDPAGVRERRHAPALAW